jgi:hypothetical protein
MSWCLCAKKVLHLLRGQRLCQRNGDIDVPMAWALAKHGMNSGFANYARRFMKWRPTCLKGRFACMLFRGIRICIRIRSGVPWTEVCVGERIIGSLSRLSSVYLSSPSRSLCISGLVWCCTVRWQSVGWMGRAVSFNLLVCTFDSCGLCHLWPHM